MLKKTPNNRRRFIKSVSGAGFLGAGITPFLNNNTHAAIEDVPELVIPDDVVYKELLSVCSGGGEGKRVLVAYASMYGTTGDIAQGICDEFCKMGWQADLQLISSVEDVSIYDAVVVGSAIRSSEWMPDAVEFLRQHEGQLSEKPIAYFLSCMRLADPNATDTVAQQVESWIKPLEEDFPLLKPMSKGSFKGALHFNKIPPIQRLFYPIISGNSVEGDFRDFQRISQWASEVEGLFSKKLWG